MFGLLKKMIILMVFTLAVSVLMMVKVGEERLIDRFEKHVISQHQVDQYSQDVQSSVKNYFYDMITFFKNSVKEIPKESPYILSVKKGEEQFNEQEGESESKDDSENDSASL